MNLQTRWEQLWSTTTSDATSILASYARLYSRYTEPHRAYHTLHHIQDCLSIFDEFKNLAHDQQVVEAALWWHDLIYDTKAVDNEHASAEVAKIDMRLLHAESDLQKRVVAAILATKHDSSVTDRDQQLVLDIDLHSLGVSSIRYKQYVTGIRREYEWVPWEAYARKRAEILEAFLNRKHIYYLLPLRERYERQARFNIRREIRFLLKS